MPGSRYNYKKDENCCEYRTGLEKILIAATITSLVIVIVLMVLVIVLSKQDKHYTNVYIAPPEPIIYSKKISEIEQTIDPSINPCDDFYKFACGNLLKKAKGNENLGAFFVIQETAKQQIEEIYYEPVQENEHKIVGVAKRLYKYCMNESAIEKDGLITIKNVLEKLGGWPVLKGSNWDESKFSWLQTEYNLRELGYFYSPFLTVTIAVDPKNDQKFIFQVSLPEFNDFGADLFDKQRLMVDVALAFGADEGRALIEIAEVLDFMLDIKREIFLQGNDKLPRRITLADVQKRYEFINWIEFMNNIVGSSIRISIYDYILFPPVKTLRKWYDFIQNTPKRIQANYITWKVIEKIIPNVPKLQRLKFKNENYVSRSTYCIEQIRQKFTPNPIDVMYVKKRLPISKRKKIKNIISNMKEELKKLLEYTHSLNSTEKLNIISRVNGLTEIIGGPDELFEDEIFDDMDVDLSGPKYGTYLELLSQVEKNRQTWLYSQMYTSKSELVITQWKLHTVSAIGDYWYDNNVIILPATIFQNEIFDEEKPSYFNYGSMGTLMAHHFLQVLGESASFFDHDGNIIESFSNLSTVSIFQNTDCFVQQLNTNETKYMLDLILPQSLGLQLSYSAFHTTEIKKEHTKENYNPEQLFWISAASYLCQPSNRVSDDDLFSLLVSVPMLNNPNFSKDFNCPSGSTMNPINKCELV